MKDDVVLPRWRDDGQQALEQFAAGEVERGGSVGPGRLQVKEDRAVGLFFETFSTDRWASEVATEALEAFTVPWSYSDACVEIVAVTDGAVLGELVDAAPMDLDAPGASSRAFAQGGHARGRGCL